MRRSFVALALAVLVPVPVMAADVTVKPGETLSDIAARYGISLTQLMKLNGIAKADHIEVGQVLKLPGSSRGGAGRAGVATGRVTVREGETLSEIAARQGMGMGQLMALNGISKADHVEVGQVLKVTGKPAVAASSYRRGASVHVVRPGESLSEIAEGYGLSMNRLVAINQIDDPNHVEIGRQLKLKGEAPVARPKPSPVAAAPQPRPATPRPAALEDSTPAPAVVSATTIAARPAVRTTPEAEGAVSRATEAASLAARPSTPAVAATVAATPVATPVATAPATGWSAPVQTRPTPVATTTAVQATAAAPRPISTAMASPAPRPATFSPAPRPAATTVATASGLPSTAAAASSADWRRYGPLRVDWSNWQPMGGSLVAPILNAKGDTLYLAINCGARKMNATSVAGDWRTWDNPQADFELKLVNDLCRSRG